MDETELTSLGAAAGRLAAMAAAALERQLDEESGDVKKAKDLSAILKDMAGLAQQLRAGEARDVTVVFSPAAEDAAV